MAGCCALDPTDSLDRDEFGTGVSDNFDPLELPQDALNESG